MKGRKTIRSETKERGEDGKVKRKLREKKREEK